MTRAPEGARVGIHGDDIRGTGQHLDKSPPVTASSPGTFYVANDIKRYRRTKAEIDKIRAAIRDLLSKDHPQTVRQIFYALTVRGVIKKVEIEYQRTACRLLTEMREAGSIPFD